MADLCIYTAGGKAHPVDIGGTGCRELSAEEPRRKALPPSSSLGGSQPRDYGSRRRLLFNHLAKAGGKYAVKVIQELVPREYLTVKIEQQQSFESDREFHFVVANFREACSYYMSLWHFSVQQGGMLRQMIMKGLVQGEGRTDIGKIFTDKDVNSLENFRSFFSLVKVRTS